MSGLKSAQREDYNEREAGVGVRAKIAQGYEGKRCSTGLTGVVASVE